jgi:peptidoglycan/LPS O-acetylase OafA/YrhL
MPLIVVTLVGAVLAGLWLPRRTALAATAALCVITMVAFVWAVSDGKGNDPWWLVLVAVAACGLALGVVAFLSRRRLRRQVAA